MAALAFHPPQGVPAVFESLRCLPVALIAGDFDPDAPLSGEVRVVAYYALEVLMGACQELVVLLMVPDKTLARRNLILVTSNVTLSAKGSRCVFLNISLSLGIHMGFARTMAFFTGDSGKGPGSNDPLQTILVSFLGISRGMAPSTPHIS